MKRLAFLLVLIGCSFPFSSALGQEPPDAQLEFVRKLRGKGYADLALEFLETLQKNSPGSMSPALLLEQARTRTALARSLDPERRLTQVNKAREELQEFLKKNASGSEALAARLELARLSTFQGQAQLSRALREETVQAQQQLANQAEQLFIQAAKEIENASKSLTDDQEKLQARFDLAINLMDQARTCIDLNKEELNRKRANIIDEARKTFESVEKEDKGELGYLSMAWLVKCYYEGTNPDLASKYYRRVMDQTARSAEPAQRWARYFKMESIPKDPTSKFKTPLAKYQAVQKEAEAWLKSYPAQHKTPAGYGVRYELARSLVSEGQLQAKDAKLQASLFKKAQDILATLNESDNDFAEKANQLNLSLSVHRVGEKTALTDLRTFDDFFLRAQIEMTKVKEVAGKIDAAKSKEEAKGLEKQRKEHFRNTIRTLSQALALADTRTSPSKLDDARYHLVVAYLMSGDPYRAAIAGEAMGKAVPSTKHSSLAAGYAIEAYANLYGQDRSDNTRQRLRELTEFVLSPECQKNWADDPVTAVARYQLAMLYNKEDNYKGAIEQLEKLPKNFSGYIYAQAQLVFIALEARDKAKTPEEKNALQDLARKVITRLPRLPGDVDTSSATMYFHAQMEEAKFLYADAADLLQKNEGAKALGKYQQMAKFLDQLRQELDNPKIRLSEGSRDQLTFYWGTMQKYARLGLAEIEYRSGNYDKVLSPELTGQVVEMVKKEAAKNPVVRLKDFQVTGDILGLALRASVQKGKVDEAKQLLKILENLKGLEDNILAESASAGVLRNLVVELQIQIRDLQKAGNQEKLKKTVASFSEFLDALVNQSKKGLEAKDIFFLAKCYDSLDQHEKAAKLYALYPAPKFLDTELKAKEKFKQEEEDELQKYWYTQAMQARQLRLAKKLNEAKKILDGLLAHKNGRQLLLAEKESNLLLEDNGLYGSAITKWGQFMNNPSLKKALANDAGLKEIYFDSYYHLTYCWYKYSQSEKVKAAGKDEQFLKKAADYIVRLETATSDEGWQIVGPRFRQLIQTDKKLEEAYKKLKGG